MAEDKKLNIAQELLQKVDEGEPTIEISRSMGFTVNLLGYESARIDTTIKISGALKNKELISKQVTEEIERETKALINDIVQQHDPNKTLLGYKK